jgi:hypothetical protein
MSPQTTLAQLPVGQIGFGAMRITGQGIWGSPRDESEAIALLRRVVDRGVTFIDTADSYSPDRVDALVWALNRRSHIRRGNWIAHWSHPQGAAAGEVDDDDVGLGPRREPAEIVASKACIGGRRAIRHGNQSRPQNALCRLSCAAIDRELPDQSRERRPVAVGAIPRAAACRCWGPRHRRCADLTAITVPQFSSIVAG